MRPAEGATDEPRRHRTASNMRSGTENGTSSTYSFEDVVHTARDLPRRARQGMRERPGLTLGAVAGLSFVAGTLLGSRFVRAAVLAVAPYAVAKALQGKLGTKAREYLAALASSATPGHSGSLPGADQEAGKGSA